MGERTITDSYVAIIAGDLGDWIDENPTRANELFAQAVSECVKSDPLVHVLSRWLTLLGQLIQEEGGK